MLLFSILFEEAHPPVEQPGGYLIWWVIPIIILVIVLLWWAMKRNVSSMAEEVAAADYAHGGLGNDNEPDDLTHIEGVGPKIAQLLGEAGIQTYAQLAATSPDQIAKHLEQAGPRYRLADPTTWPEQGALAAKGDWKGLQTLQDHLSGGKAG